MKKDIEFPIVEGVKVAIVRKKNLLNKFEWFVYLINTNDVDLHNVLITSKGYGQLNGESRRTSTLRYHFTAIEAQSYEMIEPIDPQVFVLCSEYWVSYYIGGKIYDKKFVFLPEVVREENLIYIKSLELEGVLHE